MGGHRRRSGSRARGRFIRRQGGDYRTLQSLYGRLQCEEPTAICNLFAPDLRYTLDDILNGSRDQLCGNIDKVLATPGLTLRYAEPNIHEMLGSGDLAVVRLTWTLTAETTRRDMTTDEGMDVLRRTPDGVWSTARYIAFSTRPNAALKAVVPTP